MEFSENNQSKGLDSNQNAAIKRTVLIVDDDILISEQLAKELKRNYFTTFSAVDGRSALEILNREKVDILILDVNLPDMKGIKLLEIVKKEQPDCEVIIITGFGSEEVAIQAVRRGAIDYIEKPIGNQALAAALGRAEEKLAKTRELAYQNTILLVDDEKDMVILLKGFLEKEGFLVFGAFTPTEGLKIIEHNKIDVVVTDIKMREMDGIELFKRAKGLYADIEGIVVTGFSDGDLAIKALRAGASDYITKPIDLEGFLFSINRAIERINLNRTRLYRARELKISQEITMKMNEELERRIEERSKELNKTQTQLFQTSKLATLGEMAAGLAHEINQPLGGILLVATNFRKLMERQKLTNAELESGIKDIEFSVKRMSRIIQHIRIFARQETLTFAQIDVTETIDSALNLLGEQLRLHEIEVAKTIEPDLPKILGEPFQLEQVWINLISNARDAMDEKQKRIVGGKLAVVGYRKKFIISVSRQKEPKGIRVSLTDNGIGISEENKKKVFDPFFTTKEVGKGTGLGLSISYGIIDAHKGKIEIDSRQGEETTSTVYLPC